MSPRYASGISIRQRNNNEINLNKLSSIVRGRYGIFFFFVVERKKKKVETLLFVSEANTLLFKRSRVCVSNLMTRCVCVGSVHAGLKR